MHESLSGGHSGRVFRDGNRVFKEASPWTPSVHSLMETLRNAGIEYVPKNFGVTSEGLEVLEFVVGEVPIYPLPEWVWDDDLLIDVARKMRKFHDVDLIAEFETKEWRRGKVSPSEVMCHGDIAPYNTVCESGQVISFIDWDYALPAPRGWDVGYAAYRWISLTHPDNRDGRKQNLDEQKRRLELFALSYGDFSITEIIQWAIRRLEDLISHFRSEALSGNVNMQATIDACHVALYERDLRAHN